MTKILTTLMSLSILIGGSHSWATAMSPERSKCFSMQIKADEFYGWKADLHRFLGEYDSLSSDFRFRVSVSAMTKVVSQIIELKRLGNINGHDAVINDANRLISDINSKNITKAGAVGVLKTGLIKLEESMDDIVYRAQVKNDCQLEPKAAAVAAPAASSAR